jgi:hypothetical protein
MKAIVTGMIATYPLGGVVWDYAQYALGLERMGFDVYYLEDTALQPYDPPRREYLEDSRYGVEFLARSLAKLSPTLGTRWHYRTLDGRRFGMSSADFAQAISGATLFLNVSGSALMRDEYLACPRKVLVDTDPGRNHFLNYPQDDAGKTAAGNNGFRAHDFFLTYAERIGASDCVLPTFGLPWRATRPPVLLDAWKPTPPGAAWTTVMSWKNFADVIEYEGVRYGSKEMEFDKIKTLPTRCAVPLQIATGGSPPVDEWIANGWSVMDAHEVSSSADVYRDYIQQSRGELSVAKNTYVATRSGWFSCRSVCYLAAGRPVVVQDTGFSKVIPCGSGLFAFSSIEEAAAALEEIEADYEKHQNAAREIAAAYFSHSVVLEKLLRDVGLG